MKHENVSLISTNEECCSHSLILPPDLGPPGSVFVGDVGVIKVLCLWEGQKLLKSWGAWVLPALRGVTTPNKPSKAFQKSKYNEEKGPTCH